MKALSVCDLVLPRVLGGNGSRVHVHRTSMFNLTNYRIEDQAGIGMGKLIDILYNRKVRTLAPGVRSKGGIRYESFTGC